MEEMANATEELVAELTEKHAKQVEALIKANNDAMEKLTAAIISANKSGATPSAATAAASSNTAANRAKKAAAWTLWLQAPKPHTRTVLGVAHQRSQAPSWLEIGEKHLMVRGACSNVRVAANDSE